MRLRIDRDALAEAVAWVARALPARPVVPVLSGMLLEAAGDSLTLSCFDYDVSARYEVPAEVDEPGTALVPGRLLAEIARNLSGAVAEVADDPESVELSCGAAEFTLVKLPVEDYPALPELGRPARTVDGAEFAAAVGQVAPSASRDDTLPMLTGVFAEIDGTTITLAATDRYRLAVRDLTWSPTRAGWQASALIPARPLADAARTMAAGGEVAISLHDGGQSAPATGRSAGAGPAGGMIGLRGGGRSLTTRLLGGEFLKYSSRFPAEFGSAAEMPPAPLIEAVRRVSLVADRGSSVRLAFADDEVVVEAGSQGQARAVERVPARFAGDERVIAFNPHYLLDGLTAAATQPPTPKPDSEAAADPQPADTDPPPPGRLRLEFTSAIRPAVITWSAPADPTPTFRYLVVPLRMPGST